MSTADARQQWLTSEEAREYLRIGKTKFYSLVYSGELPSYRVGRSHRLRQADLDEYMQSNRYKPGG